VRDINELQKLAEQGHDESQFLLGYNYSRGPNKDIGKAKVWLERAAMANNPRAQYYLGELCAELGRNDPRAAYSHMAYWWDKSAGHPYWETVEGMDGRAVSKRRLVWLHMNSGFENANPDEALRLLGELANKYSSPRSAIELGIVYAAGSFMPLSTRLGNAPVKRDMENGFRLMERGLKIIENGNNDIDYNLYNIIADVYLGRDGNAQRTTETIKTGIHYKMKALERATGFNESIAQNIKNEIAALENELQHAPTAQAHAVPVQENTEISQTAAPLNNELAVKFERFHAYFDTLDIDGKRDFIKSLDLKLQANPNPDYQVFLLECVEKYKAANKPAQTSPENHGQAAPVSAHASGIANTGGFRPVDPAELYSTQHEESSPDFNTHGYNETPDHYPPSNQGEVTPVAYSENGTENYNANENQGEDFQQTYIGDYDSASYTDRIHTFGASMPFLFGSILYTIGGLLLPASLWLFTDHPLFTSTSSRVLGYGLMSIIAILPILPVIAIWMIYSASKSPRAPEKSLVSLALFRVTFFIHLGVIMAGAASLALMFGGDSQALFGLSIFHNAFDLIMILGGLALVVVYVTFFYGSLFSMVKGIRDCIYSNLFDALPGVGPFSFINYLTSILLILFALAVILVGVAPEGILPIAIPMPESIESNIELWFGDSSTIALGLMAFALILSRAGTLLCTNVVNQFNAGLGEEYDEE